MLVHYHNNKYKFNLIEIMINMIVKCFQGNLLIYFLG